MNLIEANIGSGMDRYRNPFCHHLRFRTCPEGGCSPKAQASSQGQDAVKTKAATLALGCSKRQGTHLLARLPEQSSRDLCRYSRSLQSSMRKPRRIQARAIQRSDGNLQERHREVSAGTDRACWCMEATPDTAIHREISRAGTECTAVIWSRRREKQLRFRCSSNQSGFHQRLLAHLRFGVAATLDEAYIRLLC